MKNKGIMSFGIQLYRSDKLSFDTRELVPIKQVPCDSSSLLTDPLIIAADPFVFVHNGRVYLFLEYNTFCIPGVVRMISTDDFIHWSEPKTVLKESYHLSYPFVFEDHGKVYMIPETCADHSVRLYEADDDDLSHFTFKTTLLEANQEPYGKHGLFLDTSVYQKDGIYYLMTSTIVDNKNQLLLYTAPSLLGPYQLHPQSPVATGNDYGRNAGSLLAIEGKLYRVAQDCVEDYGDNVHVFEVIELSEQSYAERLIHNNIFDRNSQLYRLGGHQYNICKLGDQYVYATDYKEYHTFLMARTRRFLKKKFSSK